MSYFITGTDTGVGKTLVSCALLHAFAAQGKRVVGFKPVAAGCDDDGRNDDAKQLLVASNVQASYDQINPYCFPQAIAPHLAARHAGVRIALPRILTAYQALAAKSDEVVVEGVGGFCVPLNEAQDSADLAQQFKLPVILVVGMRLGCLNHALLTLRVIAEYQLECAGWVANVMDDDGTTRCCEASGAGVPSGRLLPQTASCAGNVSKAGMPALQENIAALQERIAAPLLGIIPFQTQPDASSLASLLNVQLLEK
ncbi:MAG: dethiobiotin synthase [Sideroxydans sp.]|nr:dethiobiotin synthase [Sideroxydans sp.]